MKAGDVDVACFLPFALFSVAMGMTAVFPDMDMRYPGRADPRRVLEAFLDEDATSAFGSPALWEPFARFLDATGTSLPRVKRLLTAGAPVRPRLHERLVHRLPRGDVFTPYGATEALPVAFIGGRRVLDETAAQTRGGAGTCVGKPVACVEVRIIGITDDDIPVWTSALELPRGAVGEIVVRGDVVTEVYDQRPAQTARAKIVDGDAVWHRMGDVGYLDAVGDLWFCGRKAHRVTTTSGVLHSISVEALFEHDGRVARAALVGVGPADAQRAVVCIELQPDVVRGRLRDDELRRGLLAQVAAMPGAPPIDALLFHPQFPVDRRHNAKIEREALALWATARMPSARVPRGRVSSQRESPASRPS